MTSATISQRLRLANRHASETFSFQCSSGQRFTATYSTFSDGSLAEIFLSNGKAGSDSDAAAIDSAVVCSIALQFGTPVDVIRKALLRDPRDVAASPLGVALDFLAEVNTNA
jgi:ribonucleoside-diphosphate reductase alpha chain